MLRLRPLTPEEHGTITRWRHSRTEAARTVERARIIWLASQGRRVPAIASELRLHEQTVRTWLKRFNADGVDGLRDAARPGRPATYTAEEVGEVIATALTNPRHLDVPFASWTLDRLEAYLNEEKGIAIKRSRIDELLIEEGLRWRTQETWFGARVDPESRLRAKKGAIETLYTQPPAGSLVVCLDQMGPESAKSHPGTPLIRFPARPDQPTERARQEIDYGRRGGGYIFGAFQPATGEALTRPYSGRTIANWVDFLEHVEVWLPAEAAHVYAIVDNLNVHRAVDVLLFCLAHPRWEFVFQPTYAAYLNLIEPWWKVLRSLALKGRRFETWEDICQAVAEATAYWNKHRHPFIWGQRRRHRPRRRAGIGLLPKVA